MKILQINSHYNQGGAARIVTYIHRQLRQEGVEAYVAYGRGAKQDDEGVYRFDHPWEIYLSALFSRFTGINGWFNRMGTKRLIRYIRKIQPDIVHLHAIHGYYLNWPMLFAYLKEHEIPVVWTFHDCHAFVGNCGYYYECRKWQEGCGSCPDIHGYPKSQFFDFTAWMWKRKKQLFTAGGKKVIVTPSRWLTEEAKSSFFGEYPCRTIPNGIDTQSCFYPRDRKETRKKYGFDQEEALVLGIAVGYRDPRKGAKYMIGLAESLQDCAKVILVGWDKANDAMLEGVDNVVTVPAIYDANVLAEYYSMADVFALTSLAENYATVNLESMACGTPVVGFDSGGTPEQLLGDKGLAVPTGDQQALNRAVREVLSGERILLRGEELAECIRRENSLEKMGKEYMEVYRSLS